MSVYYAIGNQLKIDDPSVRTVVLVCPLNQTRHFSHSRQMVLYVLFCNWTTLDARYHFKLGNWRGNGSIQYLFLHPSLATRHLNSHARPNHEPILINKRIGIRNWFLLLQQRSNMRSINMEMNGCRSLPRLFVPDKQMLFWWDRTNMPNHITQVRRSIIFPNRQNKHESNDNIDVFRGLISHQEQRVLFLRNGWQVIITILPCLWETRMPISYCFVDDNTHS